MGAVRAELMQAEKQEAEDVEMGGVSLPSHKTMVDAAMNTERKTYAQAAAQTQAEKREEKETRKGKGPNTPVAKSEILEVSGGAAGPLQRFPFVEDLNEYEEEEGKEEGTTTKAVVVHGVPTNWRINGVSDCVGRIMGEVIGVRWLLNERRREGKPASSELSIHRMKSSWDRRLV